MSTVNMHQDGEGIFRHFFEGTPDYCFVVLEDGVIGEVNGSALSLGYSRDELVGQPVLNIYAPESVDRTKTLFRRCREGACVRAEELRIITKQGEKRTVLLTASAVPTEAYGLVSLAIQHDITERRCVEQEIRASERRFRSLVEQTSDAVFCYEYALPIATSLPIVEQVKRLYDGVLVECNDVCAQSYGAGTASEVIGRSLLELFGAEPGSLDGLFETMIRNGYRTTDEEGVEVLEGGTKRYYLNNGHGIVEDGRLVRVWGTFRDVTERKEAELALKAEKELTETALNTQKDTFFVFEPKTRKAIRWNRAFREISEYSDDEIQSMRAPDSYYSKDDLAKAVGAIEDLDESDTVVVEMSLITKSGKTIPTEYIGSALRDDKGNLQYIIAIGRNITRRRQAEESLRRLNDELEQRVVERAAEAQRFRLAFQKARDPIFWADPESGLLLECNSAAERLLERGRDEILGRHLTSLHPPQDKEHYADMFVQGVFQGGSGEYDAVVMTKSGKQVPIQISASVISVGDTTVIQGTFADITERKMTQERLEESEKKYRELVEDINDAIYSVDTKGTVIYVSPAIKHLIGYEPHEVMGKHFVDFVHPEDMKEMEKGFASVLAGKNVPADYRILNKAGSYIWIRALSKAIKDDKDNVIGIRGIVSDITERKESELQIREMASFAELNPAPVLRVSPDGIIISCNPASEEILPEKAQAGASLSSLLPGLPALDLKMCMYGNLLLSREVDIEGKSYLFIFRGVSDLSQVYIYGSDITQRKRSEQQMGQMRSELLHASRAGTMGEMTAALAHELNHPLGSILNNANAARRFLEQDNPDLDEIREIINDVISEDRRANEVMRKVRNLMKKTEIGLVPLQVNGIIEEVLTLTRSEFLIENVILSKELEENLPEVAGERIQLQQVFINLIMNAIDAMKESETKRLSISTAPHDAENIMVCISDTGAGFGDKENDTLFKPFFTTKKEGMGMGLSVTRTIIKSHGGDICAQNNKDTGASFYITLPLYKERSHE